MSDGVWFFALIYLVICATVAAGVASEKDRSGLGFFFLALLFLGPLAIGIAVLADPGTPKRVGQPLPPSGPPVAPAQPAVQKVQKVSPPTKEAEPSPPKTYLVPPVPKPLNVGDRVQIITTESEHYAKEGKVHGFVNEDYVSVKLSAFSEDVFRRKDLRRI